MNKGVFGLFSSLEKKLEGFPLTLEFILKHTPLQHYMRNADESDGHALPKVMDDISNILKPFGELLKGFPLPPQLDEYELRRNDFKDLCRGYKAYKKVVKDTVFSDEKYISFENVILKKNILEQHSVST